ncbi:MAG: tetratricopeptide repeat protein [Acidobacteriota bacterium]
MARSFTKYILMIAMILALAPFIAAQDNDTPSKEDSNVKAPQPDPVAEKPRPQFPSFDTTNEPRPVPDPIIIQGSVITEDGSWPPFGTVIIRDCGPIVTKEVLVDSNGYFSFIVGDKNRAGGLMVDASENFFNSSNQNMSGYFIQGSEGWDSNPKYEKDLFGCVLRAKYDGYRSTSVPLGVAQRSGLIDAGTILMYPNSRVKGNAVSLTNLKASKNARKALAKGKEAFAKDEFKKAEEYYNSALTIYPEYSEAWIELGWLYQHQKQYDIARLAYRKALETDKSYISPYIRLAQLSALERKWEESIEYSRKALELDPISFPQAYFLNGLAYYKMDSLENAEDSIRRGIRIDMTHQIPKMHLVLANILAKKQDSSGSIESMRKYLEINPGAPDADRVRSLIKAHENNLKASRKRDVIDMD